MSGTIRYQTEHARWIAKSVRAECCRIPICLSHLYPGAQMRKMMSSKCARFRPHAATMGAAVHDSDSSGTPVRRVRVRRTVKVAAAGRSWLLQRGSKKRALPVPGGCGNKPAAVTGKAPGRVRCVTRRWCAAVVIVRWCLGGHADSVALVFSVTQRADVQRGMC